MRVARASLIIAAAALAACAEGPRHPLFVARADSPDSYGYSEESLAEDLYRVSYLGPEVRTRTIRPQWVERAAQKAEETAYDLALWRAAELSIQKGYPAFQVTEEFADLRSYILGRDYTAAISSSVLNVTPRNLGYYSATYFRPKMTLTVEMLQEPVGEALDAQETVERLKQKYVDAGLKPIAPATYYYFGPSSYLHDYDDAKARSGQPTSRY
jgi:hypothetical protein